LVVTREGENGCRGWGAGNPLLLVVLAVGLVGCGQQTHQLENGQTVPAFELPRLDGPPLVFPSDLQGKVSAIRFWADWCPFCESEMKDIEPVYRAYRDRGLAVLAVNVRQDAETAARFMERLGVSYEVVLDKDGSVARSFGVIGLPTTFFVDREGRLASRILGESTPEVFARAVEGLL
jgi:peroxiredoxin